MRVYDRSQRLRSDAGLITRAKRMTAAGSTRRAATVWMLGHRLPSANKAAIEINPKPAKNRCTQGRERSESQNPTAMTAPMIAAEGIFTRTYIAAQRPTFSGWREPRWT